MEIKLSYGERLESFMCKLTGWNNISYAGSLLWENKEEGDKALAKKYFFKGLAKFILLAGSVTAIAKNCKKR